MSDNRRKANEDAILAALAKYDELPYGASYRDLSEATGLGLGTVFRIVQYFVGTGAVEHTPVLARSIRRKLSD